VYAPPVPELLPEIIDEIRARPAPRGMATKIVAVDGPGGAGKSTLAERLAAELGGAPIIHTDDFASWDNPVDWWPDLIEQALQPLAAGLPARFTLTTWGGPARASRVVEPSEIVILEGVSASREAFRPFLTYSIWIETPRDLRLRRGLDRDHRVRIALGLEPDPEQASANWRQWMAAEDEYVARERPQAHADRVVSGCSTD